MLVNTDFLSNPTQMYGELTDGLTAKPILGQKKGPFIYCTNNETITKISDFATTNQNFEFPPKLPSPILAKRLV